MFDTGKTFKVRVETHPQTVGFGRATVVEKQGNHLFVQVSTSKESNSIFPKGTRLCFVSSSNLFNGLWTTTVVGAKIIGGKTVMECGTPKFEPAVQKRKSQRVPLVCPVKLICQPGIEIAYSLHTFNISRSGVGIETTEQYVDEFPVGEQVEIVIESPAGDILVVGRVIRTQYNWLANRNAIGLEFIEMDNESRERLNTLINMLTGQQSATEPCKQEPKSGLSTWVKTSRDDPRFVKSSQQDTPKIGPGNGDQPG
ncbi:MAG: PilZ domain-containing protein [Candidatus Melainabacteria bacterium]|nr:PilZ domain-containing protein [Candidatus Melainabacteria bacterium]